ncbi:Protein phosphatase methylesterase 1 [Coemansia spiralis]|uniref:Protein phosphatase methylesterase 1 n=2 Tax=Coemansia TaxID=4863 RepID=A0A9W8G9W1_9FUNG|nr:Alpha/Beta hydrolase protein [Coemansia spiralis]KAJ1992735.1 Protein phosphatase methylesterase 1 [Coemansia umbellata]KAJ2623321.1 Protein phosphatase methylesterase 1 [Coemansia sp. RSA 1358]KAJ2678872.1 Protein phosphatase methylesterase 1 [Coemansia spiralis]
MDLRQSIFKPGNVQLPPLDDSTDSNSAHLKPLPWSNYFEDKQNVSVGDTHFNVYSSGMANTSGPVFVFHHGAGHSGLTFGLVSQYIYNSDPSHITVVAPDFRGHGDTIGENQDNLSLDRLVDDLAGIVDAMFPDNKRHIVLVGHSMGGAVVAHAAASKKIRRVLGLALIDIVEGSAMDSLSAIPAFINARPQTFRSVESAIRWHIDAEHIQNRESARLSVPSLIKPISKEDDSKVWAWRTQLMPSQRFWRGWYSELSRTFVSAPTAKLLVLAGTDRLDKELLIAQMQGKFQLELLPAAGHTIQEDLPQRVGDVVLSFWKRNQPLDISAIRRVNPVPS